MNNEKSLCFWEALIDAAIESGSVKKVEKAFRKAFVRAPSAVAAHLKVQRLNFLNEANVGNADAYREAYKEMASRLPTRYSNL